MREAVKRRLEILLHTHDTPRRTAAAYALGVFWGFSAPLGLHTILGLASAFALRLNRVAALLGIYSNLPWIIVPYYMLATVAGAAILGVQPACGPDGRVQKPARALHGPRSRKVLGTAGPAVLELCCRDHARGLILALAAYGAALFFILAHRHRVERAKHSDTTTSVM